MNRKWDTLKGTGGFFLTMAVCLAAMGVSGYFLLSEPESPAVEPIELPPVQEHPVPAPQVSAPPETVDVLAPTPVATPPAPMPEAEIDDTPVVPEEPSLIVTPVSGEVVMAFSVDELAYDPTLEDWRTHSGIDIAAASGSTVLSACSGTVLAVEEDPLMGVSVTVEHEGGYQTTYANLQAEPNVAQGDLVSAGQIIGAVGTSAAAEAAQGPHLHFEVSKDGQPVDPAEFLEQ